MSRYNTTRVSIIGGHGDGPHIVIYIYVYRASYTLIKVEKETFFEVRSSIKVTSGFSSNIKGIINMAEKKIQNLKSHDCHVIMTQLLPVN